MNEYESKLAQVDRLIEDVGKLFGGVASVTVDGQEATAPANKAESDHYPSNPATILIGREIPQPITNGTLAAAINRTDNRAWHILNQWKNWGWVKQEARGKYFRTENFGVKGKAVSPPAPQPESPEPYASKTNIAAATGKFEPCSPEGKAICLNLNPPFSTMDVNVRLDVHNTGKAGYFLAEWVKQGWVEKCGFNVYRHTEKVKA